MCEYLTTICYLVVCTEYSAGTQVGLRIMISQNKSHSSLTGYLSIVYKSKYWPSSKGHESDTVPDAKDMEMNMIYSLLSGSRIYRRQICIQMIKIQRGGLWVECYRGRRERQKRKASLEGKERTSKDHVGMTLELRMRDWEFSKPVVGGLGSGFMQRNLIYENVGHDRE